MKIQEYVEKLNEIAQKYPDVEVVYSADDEGNRFEKVHFAPTLGNFKDGEFRTEPEEDMEEFNCVCLN